MQQHNRLVVVHCSLLNLVLETEKRVLRTEQLRLYHQSPLHYISIDAYPGKRRRETDRRSNDPMDHCYRVRTLNHVCMQIFAGDYRDYENAFICTTRRNKTGNYGLLMRNEFFSENSVKSYPVFRVTDILRRCCKAKKTK